ncbi:ATPase [Vibrio panuliri]|uniref:ATPase n=1 Tax=Vibrio panuliri TaxID=1381081 RepID=A0A1Q9HA94_9VIBR|nr:AAA family ATPase [Vibrio panuliri]OLQ86056.1 ATPase [Vibrio panuliri]
MLPIIITGGPGAGKTSLVNHLAARGYATFAEVSRTLIEQQAQLVDGILPWHDLPGFADLCLTHMGEQKQQAAQHSVAFLDRAIPDICGYLAEAELEIDARYIEASAGYHSQVFFCRPHKAIYVQDDVRPYPFDGALAIHDALVAIYQQLGYQVVEVPWGTLEERAAFIESTLALSTETLS